MYNPVIALAGGLLIFLAGSIAGCSSTGPKVNEHNAVSSPANTAGNSTLMPDEHTIKSDFFSHLPEGFQQPSDAVGKRLLKEYGSVFVAGGGAVVPKMVIFPDQASVAAFQASVKTGRETIGGVAIELQEPAMQALKDALADASKSGLTITPRGADAAKRSYDDTVQLWKSRVDPALAHWTQSGRISPADADRIRALSPFEQVPEILKLEDQGVYFAKDFSKSIIYSVAPPGTSQHLSMLALDVAEFDDARVRSVLAAHGWYQTVVSDVPHFTFLGVPETQLPELGLQRVESDGRVFWVPNI